MMDYAIARAAQRQRRPDLQEARDFIGRTAVELCP
jgi:hypothetical protein